MAHLTMDRGRVWIAALLLLVFYLAIGLALRAPTDRSKIGVGGDEHHYLTVAISIVEDGDLVVLNNYEEGAYVDYLGVALDPSLWNLIGGKGYSGHSPGAGILVVPGFALAGWVGVLGSLSLAMAIAFALSAKAVAHYNRRAPTNRQLLILIAGFAGLPLIAYSHTLYPETFMTPVVAALGLLAIVHWQSKSPWSRAAAALGAVGLGGLSIGLHPKYSIVLIGVTVYFIVVETLEAYKKRDPTMALWAMSYAGVAALFLLLFSWFHSKMWDAFSPVGWFPRSNLAVDTGQAMIQFLDLFLGREFGLFLIAPFSMLAVGLVVASVSRQGRSANGYFSAFLLVLLITITGPAAFSAHWHAGDSPIGRYASPLLPMLLIAAALLVGGLRRGRWIFLWILAGLGMAWTLAYAVLPETFRPRQGLLGAVATVAPFMAGAEEILWTASEPSPWLPSTVLWGAAIVVSTWLFRDGRRLESALRPPAVTQQR